jgi:4-hydroxy-tetrahydrodipicolinate reductase
MSLPLALLGAGKTGGHFLELASEKGHQVEVYRSSRPLTKEELYKTRYLICFLPGSILETYLPLLMESSPQGLSIISGSTGWERPEKFEERLKEKGVTWIQANNFSLAMILVKQMLQILGRASSVFPDLEYSLSESHHTKKLDAPSGTALSWRSWLGEEHAELEIESIREGDIVGIHELKMESPFEQIELKHTAKSRQLFASGALWCAEYIHANPRPAGFYEFDTLVTQEFLCP